MPLVNTPAQQQLRSFVLRNNSYWQAGGAEGVAQATALSPHGLYKYNGQSFSSLDALRAASGLETAADGTPTGTDSDPHLTDNGRNGSSSADGGFFRQCVHWWKYPPGTLPQLLNSGMLNAIRGFAGCSSSMS